MRRHRSPFEILSLSWYGGYSVMNKSYDNGMLARDKVITSGVHRAYS
jgi:hypothetical protein